MWIRISGWLLLILAYAVCAEESAQLADVASRYFDRDFLLKSAEYHRFERNLFLIQTGVLLSALWMIARGPLGVWNQKAIKLTGGRLWLARALILCAVYSSLALLRLPFAVIRYYHAHAFGLRNDSLCYYLVDWCKGFTIIGAIVVVLGAIILGIYARFPRAWTLLATSVTGILATAYTFYAPALIEPWFYEFRPLQDPVLEQRLLNITRCAGVEVGQILVANASKHSDSVNAYVSGIGTTARIVLYDTLLQKFNADEVAIVLAHEIGHRVSEHIRTRLLLGIFGLWIALWIADRVFGHCVRIRLRGIASRQDPALVVPGYALYVMLTLMVLVPGNVLTQHMESEADRIALELSQDPDTFIQSRVRAAHANLSEVFPPEWVEFTLYTHPSIARRIRTAENFQRNPRSCAP